ncbi:hypothetical protein [Synechococcus elongatus]|uniref:DUF4157 domain-containing protein n=1 Tax=Synechococcus elongatus PCC 11802 TaxID=2283154 RepID=A0AAT9K2T3_SYNEL|nr:hypothetical protein [Synechococcus elongatus]QFZ91501.1 hypothetical protein EKO22_03080 [Synechococcus elongatus PCC 11802]
MRFNRRWRYGLGLSALLIVLGVQGRQQWQQQRWADTLGITASALPSDRLVTLADWQRRLEPRQFTPNQQQQLQPLLIRLQRLGISVELEAEPHDRYAGLWLPSQRQIRLNPRLLRSPTALLHSLSHESVHVAQSCRSNFLWGYSPVPLGLPTTPAARQRVDRSLLYQNYPGDRRVEYEAHTYAQQPEQVVQILNETCPES